jgi:hypothetical protein
MYKVEEIFKAWVIAANPSKEAEILAAKRHAICLDCKFIKNSLIFKTKCGECGCPINKKIFSPKKGACRIGKWDMVDGVEEITYMGEPTNIKKNKSII